jgi:putative heme-binding domain-containing protein
VVEDDSAIPQDILKYLDLNSGRDRGRIYRIVPENFKRPLIPTLSTAKSPQLADSLDHPDAWVRETAQRLLYEKRDTKAVERLRELATKATSAQGKLHALHAMEPLIKELDGLTYGTLLRNEDPRVRQYVVWDPQHAVDPDARVRFTLALSLSRRTGIPRKAQSLLRIIEQGQSDPWVRTAVLLASWDCAPKMIEEMLRSEIAKRPEANEFMGQLAQMVGASNEEKDIAAVLELVTSATWPGGSSQQLTVLRQLADGMAKSGTPLAARAASNGKLHAFFDQTAKTAADSTKTIDERVNAVQVVAFAPYEMLAANFSHLLDSTQPPPIQTAAVKALANRQEAEVGHLIVANWRNFGPASRADAMDALLRRPQRAVTLLDAIENGKIPAGELDQQQKQRLLKHSDATIRARAGKLFNALQNSNRQQVIDTYRAAISNLNADAMRGQKIFEANCAICHQQGAAGNVGPKLGELQDRSPDTLLVSILDPNRDVKANYVNYLLITRDGDDLSGCIVAETPTGITIRRAGGLEDTILRKNIKSLRATSLSLMPEGLETGINQQQMADLLGYLQTYKD